jgi:hypothetical protein
VAYVRAWNDLGAQYGFGPNGAIDVERVQLVNPPVLVPSGPPRMLWDDEADAIHPVYDYVLDPREAFLQSLAHTARASGKLGGEIVPDSLGRTTTTVRPFAGAGGGGNPIDGYIKRDASEETYATIIAGAGTGKNETGTSIFNRLQAGTTTDRFAQNWRTLMGFVTSAVGSDTVDDATLSLYGRGRYDQTGSDPDITIVEVSPASDDDIVNADYGTFGSTSFAAIAAPSISTSAFNDFVFNAAGEAAINGAGISHFGCRHSWDNSGSFGGTWASGVYWGAWFFSADQSGTSNDPVLVVNHSAAAGGNPWYAYAQQ